jgi:hypothetical protein
MDELRQQLAPLTDWIPDPIRGYLPVQGWWLAEFAAALAVLVVVGYIVRGFLRALWRGMVGQRRQEWDRGLRIHLDELPAPNGMPSLCVYHVPAWVRLVVVAPVGRVSLDPDTVPALLDRVLPGLGQVARRDQAELHLWPAPLSTMGFTNAFHRCTPTGRREGEATGWIVLAGRIQGGSLSVFLGMVLWATEPTTFGRLNLEPRQWFDVLRIQRPGVRP